MAKKQRRKKSRGAAKRSRASERARRARAGRSSAKAALARLVVAPKGGDPRVAQVTQRMKVYEGAMRHFNHKTSRRAKETLEKVLAGPSRELAERARVHLAICEQRLQRGPAVPLRGADEHYPYEG